MPDLPLRQNKNATLFQVRSTWHYVSGLQPSDLWRRGTWGFAPGWYMSGFQPLFYGDIVVMRFVLNGIGLCT